MGKTERRSRSRSAERRRDKSHRHKDDRDRRSRSRDRKKDRKHSKSTSRERYLDKFSSGRDGRERKSKFDTNAAGERVDRRSKWGDQPVKAITPVSNIAIPMYDPNRISIQTSNIDEAAIQINQGGQNPHNSLQQYQAHIFDSILASGKLDPVSGRNDVHIEDIRPNMGQIISTDLSSQGITIHTGPIETTKIKRKIYIPRDTAFNYTGLIIGPKGSNQKRLEEVTGCKILVRGRGSQKEGQAPQPDDNEDQHVLIIADSELQIAKATAEIERILFADEDTRAKIKQEQLKMVAQLKNDPNFQPDKQPPEPSDPSLTTPFGPPSPNAFVIAVPNDCVGLVIGKGGETIKMLQTNSGARRVQVAVDSAPGSGVRNLFVEGDRESYDRVKKMIEEIIDQQKERRQQQQRRELERMKEEVLVPNNLVGLVIGKGGESVKGIMAETGASIFIPKECEPGTNERKLLISGRQDQIDSAKQLIFNIVDTGQRNLAMKALQAQGVNPAMLGMPQTDAMQAAYMQQMMMGGMDPNYAAMYQQMMYQQMLQQQQQQQQAGDGTQQQNADGTATMTQNAGYYDQNALMQQSYQMMLMMQNMQNAQQQQQGADGQQPSAQ